MPLKKKPKLPSYFNLSNLLILIGLLLLGANFLLPRRQSIPRVPYSIFISQVESGQVAAAQVGEQEIRYYLKAQPEEGEEEGSEDGQAKEQKVGQLLATTPIFDLSLPERLQKNGVVFQGAPPPQTPWLGTLFSWVIPPIILVLMFQLFMNRDRGSGTLYFSKSKAKIYVEGEDTKITFADVAGVEEAKTELAEIVEFLKSPDRFTAIGAKIPKGVLLVGPPGTGKTLLAKAVAGEAGVAFFTISASEFVELFVGTGAARVRDLFEQAKQKAPCIIFIDELDAIGKSRSGGGGVQSGSNDEREQTLNQLLTEMDGFAAGKATVIVLAATNRPETLDAALLRPGRFDRQVLVDRPDLAGREAILNTHAQKVKLGPDVDMHKIAVKTPGFAGADLANLVNEAALLAARNHREAVTLEDFNEAIERVIAGLEKKSRVLSDKEKKVVAYHEVGHALVGAIMPGAGKVTKISIVPRGMSALGYTLKMPTEDRFLMDDTEFCQQIAMLLGGRAAEEIVFNRVTNGASDDLQRATNLAEKMVTAYGMSKVLGPLAYQQSQSNNFLGNGSMNVRRMVSEETAKAIDEEVKHLVETAHQEALDLLTHNRELLETITDKLLTTEVIEGEELEQLLSQVQPVPQDSES
jgi:cell division protease FtsH